MHMHMQRVRVAGTHINLNLSRNCEFENEFIVAKSKFNRKLGNKQWLKRSWVNTFKIISDNHPAGNPMPHPLQYDPKRERVACSLPKNWANKPRPPHTHTQTETF